MNAIKIEWTKTMPTEDGIYWTKWNKGYGKPKNTFALYQLETGRRGQEWWVFGNPCAMSREDLARFCVEFSAPIDEPEED